MAMERRQKITCGEMRQHDVTGILVYCSDYHLVTMADPQWPDAVRLSDIEPRFICTVRGKRGADIPDFAPARMGIR